MYCLDSWGFVTAESRKGHNKCSSKNPLQRYSNEHDNSETKYLDFPENRILNFSNPIEIAIWGGIPYTPFSDTPVWIPSSVTPTWGCLRMGFKFQFSAFPSWFLQVRDAPL